MRKKLGIIFGIVAVLLFGIYFSKNYIIKKVLENKLTEINKGKVDIGKVDFSPFLKKIIIEDIDITSRKNGMKNFISIGKFETDYDIYFKEKKILVNKADFTEIEFMTERKTNGSTGFVVEEPNEVEVNTEENLDEKKQSSLQDLEELIKARAMVNQITLKNMLENQYEKIEKLLKEKESYWKEKLENIEKTPEYMILKKNFEKISEEKNPLKLLRMEKEFKNMGKAFKVLSKEFLQNRKDMQEDFKNITSIDEMNKELEKTVNELVGRGEFVVTDLDSIINYYLNEIYGEKIEKMVIKYRDVMREIELRKEEDAKLENKWEIFAEDIVIKSKLYGIELKSEIKNISSRLSRNKENIEIYLGADSNISHGEAYGYIDLNKIQGKFDVNISNFNFEDLKDMEVLNRYVTTGEASLVKEVILGKDDIDIRGDVEIHDMSLNGEEIIEKLNIDAPLLKAMVIPILKDLSSGNVHYEYNSINGNLLIKSDLSAEIMDILNDENGAVKKKIIEDMLKEGKEEIKKYNLKFDKENKSTLGELQNKLDEKSKYLDRVQDILDKYNLNNLLDKF